METFTPAPIPLEPSTDIEGTVQPHRLCRQCTRISNNSHALRRKPGAPSNGRKEYVDTFKHHESSVELWKSAESGCHLCTLIFDYLHFSEIDRMQKIEIELPSQRRLKKRRRKTSYKIVLSGDLELRLKIGHSPDAKVCRMPLSISAKAGYDKRCLTSLTTGSSASFSAALVWLQRCLAEHPNCLAHFSSDREPPTRLIDVKSNSEFNDPCVYQTQESDNGLEYLTLSHCWGGGNVVQLTIGNFSDLATRIPMGSLPRTFQDAIIITRRLGYRYIWIDALCVVQDSTEDWKRESATMDRVYSNAVVTIAASWGENSNSGCFVQREPLKSSHCKIGDLDRRLYVEPREVACCLDHHSGAQTPLHNRAWVLQERLLSPRILRYGPYELHWECQTLTACESKPNGKESHSDLLIRTSRILTRPLSRIAGQGLLSPDILRRSGDRQQFYSIWDTIMYEYWHSKLTYHSDILVALSGIARKVEMLTGLTLAHGLWQELFPFEILWAVRFPVAARDSSVFPTWSWASIQGSQIYRGFLGLQLDSQIQARLVSLSESKKLATIRGPLLSATIRRIGSRHWWVTIPDRCARDTRIEPDVTLPDICEVMLLLVVTARDVSGLHSWKPCYAGLVLQKQSSVIDKYIRLGYFGPGALGKAADITLAESDFKTISLV